MSNRSNQTVWIFIIEFIIINSIIKIKRFGLNGLTPVNLVFFDQFFEILMLWMAMFYNAPALKIQFLINFWNFDALGGYVLQCSSAQNPNSSTTQSQSHLITLSTKFTKFGLLYQKLWRAGTSKFRKKKLLKVRPGRLWLCWLTVLQSSGIPLVSS